MSLRIAAAHRPPLCFIEGGENGSAAIFSGYLVDLLPTLLKQANIRTIYEITRFVGSGGSLTSNGSWTGIMGELTSGRADMALFPLTLTAQRAQYIQHTQPFMDDGYGILVRTRQVDSGYSFLLPFEGLTWAMFIAALLAVVLLITILDLVTRRARLRAFERLHGSRNVHRMRKRDKLMNHAIETVMMAVGSGSAPTSRSWSVKIVFVAWAIFCVIMLSAYTANLTANMTVNQIGLNVKSLQDLAQMPAPFGVPADSSISAYFRNGTDQGARMLLPKMIEYRSSSEAAEAVRSGKLSAYINDYTTVQYFTQEPPCDLALASDTVGSGQLVLGLAPNSTLAVALNTALLQLSEAGYMAELRRKWFVEASQCTSEDRGAGGNGRLRMSQAWTVFLILAAGAAVAVAAAAMEVIYYKRLFAGVYNLKQDLSTMGPKAVLKKHAKTIKSVKFIDGFDRGTSGSSMRIDHDIESPSIEGGSSTGKPSLHFKDSTRDEPNLTPLNQEPFEANMSTKSQQQQQQQQQKTPKKRVRLTAQVLRAAEMHEQTAGDAASINVGASERSVGWCTSKPTSNYEGSTSSSSSSR